MKKFVMMHGKLATYESIADTKKECEDLFFAFMKTVTTHSLVMQDYYNMGYYIEQVSVQPVQSLQLN